jgi:CRISPR-associated protein Cmr1
MERITIELEAVTPVFAHVEPDGDARWRAAPFRGLARWWFRAVVGAAKPPGEVRKDEAALFGTAEQPSAVAFRVFSEPSSSSRTIDADINPGSKRSARRKAIPPGGRATLEIVSARRDGTQNVRRAYAALWVALHLGGLGQRSRRGAGSIKLTSVAGPDVMPAPIAAKDAASYARELEDGLRSARKVLGVTSLRAISGDGEFPLLHPGCAQVHVAAPGWPAREDAAREALMSIRRQPEFHQAGRQEFEFGGIKPRLASPLWVRFAVLNPVIVVLTLFEHRAATRLGAKWVQAKGLAKAIVEKTPAPSSVDPGEWQPATMLAVDLDGVDHA